MNSKLGPPGIESDSRIHYDVTSIRITRRELSAWETQEKGLSGYNCGCHIRNRKGADNEDMSGADKVLLRGGLGKSSGRGGGRGYCEHFSRLQPKKPPPPHLHMPPEDIKNYSYRYRTHAKTLRNKS